MISFCFVRRLRLLISMFGVCFFSLSVYAQKNQFPDHYPLIDSLDISYNLERNLLELCQQELKDTSLNWWEQSVLYQNYFSAAVQLFYPTATIKSIWIKGFEADPHSMCRNFQTEFDRITDIRYHKNIPIPLHAFLLRERGFILPSCSGVYEKYDSSLVILFSKLDRSKLSAPQHRVFLDSLYASLGKYPGRSEVGIEKEDIAAKIIQHGSLEYILKYLPEIKSAVAQKNLHPRYLAPILDKIEILQGRPQIYGTQSKVIGESSTALYPILDEQNVDKRRISMGLSPMKDPNSILGNLMYKLTDIKEKE